MYIQKKTKNNSFSHANAAEHDCFIQAVALLKKYLQL